jgi:outer membrane protein assembly factor BamD (BamD/ComL family)
MIISFHNFDFFSQKYLKLIEKKEFDKAITKINRKLKRDPLNIECLYYSSLIYSSKSAVNHFNLDKSYFEFQKLVITLDKLSLNEKLNQNELKITKKKIEILSDSIFTYGLQIAANNHTELSYINFLQNFDLAPLNFKIIAIEKRNLCAFDEAKKKNTIMSFQSFVDKYPESELARIAIIRRDSIAFLDAKNTNSVDSIKQFINKYPKSNFISEAEISLHNLAFQNAKMINSIESYQKYINDYPTSKHYDSVILMRDEKAFEKSNLEKSVDAYSSFIQDYPNSTLINRAIDSLHQIAFEEVKIKNTKEEYESFVRQYPNSIQVFEANENIELFQFKELINSVKLDEYYSFISKCNNQNLKDSALLKLEEIKFNNVWNENSIESLENFLKEFKNSSRKVIVLNKLDSLYFDLALSTKDQNVIDYYIDNFPNLKNKKVLESIKNITKNNFDIQKNHNFLLENLPGYFSEDCKIIEREISFLDRHLLEKLNSTFNKSYYLDEKFNETRIGPDGRTCHECHAKELGSDFRVLKNNWYYHDNTLFKYYNDKIKGTKGEISFPRDNISKFSRSYSFSDSLVIDPNGYLINLFSNNIVNFKSCDGNKPLKAFITMDGDDYILDEFLKEKIQINHPDYEYLPHWANETNSEELIPIEGTDNRDYRKCKIVDAKYISTYNDSLVWFLVPFSVSPKILDFPINSKIYENVGFKEFEKRLFNFEGHPWDSQLGDFYFLKKFNLNVEIPGDLKKLKFCENFNVPKKDSYLIFEFNHKTDRLNYIYDRSLLPLMPYLVRLDRTGQFLIVQTYDNIKDDFNSGFDKKPEYDFNRSIVIFDIKEKRELISFTGFLNDLTEENKLIINAYEERYPKKIFYDVLDLNELILYKDRFNAPKITTSLNLDQFTTNEQFLNDVKNIEINNFNNIDRKIDLNRKNNLTVYDINQYDTYSSVNKIGNELLNFCNCFYDSVSKLPQLISIPLIFKEYELNRKTIYFESKPLNEFEFNLFTYDSHSNYSIDYDTRKITVYIHYVEPDKARLINDKSLIQIEFEKNIKLDINNLSCYVKNPIIDSCKRKLNLSNSKNLSKYLSRYYNYPNENLYRPLIKYFIITNEEKKLIFVK